MQAVLQNTALLCTVLMFWNCSNDLPNLDKPFGKSPFSSSQDAAPGLKLIVIDTIEISIQKRPPALTETVAANAGEGIYEGVYLKSKGVLQESEGKELGCIEVSINDTDNSQSQTRIQLARQNAHQNNIAISAASSVSEPNFALQSATSLPYFPPEDSKRFNGNICFQKIDASQPAPDTVTLQYAKVISAPAQTFQSAGIATMSCETNGVVLAAGEKTELRWGPSSLNVTLSFNLSSNPQNGQVDIGSLVATGPMSAEYSAPAEITQDMEIIVMAIPDDEGTFPAVCKLQLVKKETIPCITENSSLYPGEQQVLKWEISNPELSLTFEVEENLGTVEASDGQNAIYTAPNQISEDRTITITTRSSHKKYDFAACTVALKAPVPLTCDEGPITLRSGESATLGWGPLTSEQELSFSINAAGDATEQDLGIIASTGPMQALYTAPSSISEARQLLITATGNQRTLPASCIINLVPDVPLQCGSEALELRASDTAEIQFQPITEDLSLTYRISPIDESGQTDLGMLSEIGTMKVLYQAPANIAENMQIEITAESKFGAIPTSCIINLIKDPLPVKCKSSLVKLGKNGSTELRWDPPQLPYAIDFEIKLLSSTMQTDFGTISIIEGTHIRYTAPSMISETTRLQIIPRQVKGNNILAEACEVELLAEPKKEGHLECNVASPVLRAKESSKLFLTPAYDDVAFTITSSSNSINLGGLGQIAKNADGSYTYFAPHAVDEDLYVYIKVTPKGASCSSAICTVKLLKD